MSDNHFPFNHDRDDIEEIDDSIIFDKYVKQIVGSIDCHKYIRDLRSNSFPKNDLRIYFYDEVDVKKFSKNIPLFDLNTGHFITTYGSGLPPEECSYKTNRWVFQDTNINLCDTKPLKLRDYDYALAFSGVKDKGLSLCVIMDFYDFISSPDVIKPTYLTNYCENSEIMLQAINLAKNINANTFVDWAKHRQCMKYKH